MDKDTQKVMFSSEKNMWETPQSFFEELDAEFHFTLDAAASHTNRKCARYFTAEENGLEQDWGGETVFCNPPYGNRETGLWTKKCYEEAQKPGTTVVMLIPARTDRASFHDYIQGKAEVRFVRGRLKFELGGKPILDKDGRPMGAPFPSMVVIFRPPEEEEPLTVDALRGMDRKERRTNADRIRSMTDEELASALVKYEGTETRPTPYGGHEHIFHGPHGETCGTRAYALQLWKGWLRQPAEESSS